MSPTITISKSKYQKLTEIARNYRKIPRAVRREHLDDEKPLTPRQKAIIDRGIAEGLEDIRKGRTYGPFDTIKEFHAFLDRSVKKVKTKKS